MGLQVLIVGQLRPELGVSGTHEGVPVADVRHPDAVQEAISRLGGSEGSVLVLCSRAETFEIRRQLALVSVALPRVQLLLEPVGGPPLSVAAAARLTNDTDGTRDPAHQLATLDALRNRSWAAVWLPSVSKLSHPQPSLAQHVRSWFGGPGFLAVHGASPRVIPCRDTSLPAVEGAPAQGVLMVAETAAPRWVVPSAASNFSPVERVDHSSWRDPRDAFGVNACVEMLVMPADLSDPAQGSLEPPECPACGNHHSRAVCPYCRMVMPASSDLRGADA